MYNTASELVEREALNLAKHDAVELFDPFRAALLKDELDHVVSKYVLHKTWLTCQRILIGFALGCQIHLDLEEFLLISADLLIKGINDGSLCALATTQLHLYELRTKLVATEFTHMAKHLAHQSLPDLLAAWTTLVPDVILKATFDASPSIIVALLVGLMTGSSTTTFLHLVVHWHEVLKLLVDQN